MIFLLEYDRKKGKLVSFKRFEDCEREEAQDARLELELRLFRSEIEHEVVIWKLNPKNSSEEPMRVISTL